MFVALARLVSRNRPLVLAGTLGLLALAVVALVRGGTLTSGTIEGTESAEAAALVRGAAGADTDTSVVALFSHPSLPATDPVFQAGLFQLLEKVAGRPEVEGVVSVVTAPAEARDRFVSRDGKTALVLVRSKGDEKAAVRAFPAVKATLRDGPFEVALTGKPAFLSDLNTELEHDLLRAELISLAPRAPGAPLGVPDAGRRAPARRGRRAGGGRGRRGGARALAPGRHGAVHAQRRQPHRPREWPSTTRCSWSAASAPSCTSGATVQAALERTMDTAGRAVAFSGLAVAAGLSGLLFYRGSYLAAMGLGGAIVVAFSVLFALTRSCRPSSAGSGPGWTSDGSASRRSGSEPGLWHRLAEWVMAHPLRVLVPTLGFIVLVGWPFLRLADRRHRHHCAARVGRVAPGRGRAGARLSRAERHPHPGGGPLPGRPVHPGARRRAVRRHPSLGAASGRGRRGEHRRPRPGRDARTGTSSSPGPGRAFRPPQFALAEAAYLHGDVAVVQVLARAPASTEEARRLVVRAPEGARRRRRRAPGRRAERGGRRLQRVRPPPRAARGGVRGAGHPGRALRAPRLGRPPARRRW